MIKFCEIKIKAQNGRIVKNCKIVMCKEVQKGKPGEKTQFKI